jgi:Uma2 family endonuclease
MSQAIITSSSPAGRAPPRVSMTFDEFLARTDEHAWAEWVDGEVITLTASFEHQDLCLFLARIVSHFVEQHDLGKVYIPPFAVRCLAALPAREPDLLFIRKDRLHLLRPKFLDGPADLVVEVVGDDSRTRDRRDKFREYAAGGVREYWLIDQPRKQAEFFLLGDQGAFEPLPIGEDGVVRSVVLDGLWLDVAWFWLDPLPTLADVLARLQAGPKAGA